MLSKYIVSRDHEPLCEAGEIPITAIATVFLNSEAIDHPVDYAFDNHRGPGGTRWVAQERGKQTIIVAFDSPQTIREVTLEIEERLNSRTQLLELSVSKNWGESYRTVRQQEYTFSPRGSTFELEKWAIDEGDITHVRLSIKPDKGGKECHASLVSLAFRR